MSSRLLLGLYIGLLLFSCNSGEKMASKKDLSKDERIAIETEELGALLEAGFEQDSVKLSGFWITTGTELGKFYTQNNGKLFWFEDGKPKEHTKSFLKFLGKSEYYGLDSNFYHYNQVKKGLDSLGKTKNFYAVAKCEAVNDVLLTNAWMLAAVHLNKGLLDPENLRVIWKRDSLENKNLAGVLAKSNDTSILTKLLAYQPNFIEYRMLKLGMKNFLDSNILDTVSFKLVDPKKDSSACWNEINKALIHWKYITIDTLQRDSIVKLAKKFQADNGLDPDAIIGPLSRKAFATSNVQRFHAAALAFEKWRWKKPRDGKLEFHVNIPAYELHALRNDSIIRRHRVVTGAPDTRSPTFTAKIKYITLFPYWHVPHSIASKEISVFLRRDSSYLRKGGYTLLNRENEPIDLSTVKWKSLNENYFPYKVRQTGGYGNSLGLVVFQFPNKHDVYLHDTPSKRFFNKSVRCFSHGCIRLQNPLDMATFVISQDKKWKKDEFNKDTLMAWIGKHYEQRYNLKKYIPIEIDYITVTADSIGNMTFHPDVYDKDVELLKVMNPLLHYKPKKKPEKKKEEAEEKIKATAYLNSRKKIVV
ncbi:MAG TPA: L,D-transpeptidase family protein [Flavobacteriales bacterium]|nr:L,D-transpeptidase family protein [Flavobacteriales bacterium]